MALSIAKAISSTDTSLLVNGTIQNISGPGILTVESEQMSYTGNSENEFFGLVRGYNSTTAVAHAVGVAVSAAANEPSGVGDINGTLPVVVSGGTGVLLGASATVSMHVADSTHSGYLSSTDFSRLSSTSGSNTGDETRSTIITKLANSPLQLLASDPVSPTEGMVWYNTTSHTIKFYDGTTIQTVAHV